jgi:hypothetical protein
MTNILARCPIAITRDSLPQLRYDTRQCDLCKLSKTLENYLAMVRKYLEEKKILKSLSPPSPPNVVQIGTPKVSALDQAISVCVNFSARPPYLLLLNFEV